VLTSAASIAAVAQSSAGGIPGAPPPRARTAGRHGAIIKAYAYFLELILMDLDL
jgi:hypothetical protein